MTRRAPVTGASPARQLNTFLARFDPKIRGLARAARAKLRRRMPTAIELVYDNYRALAIGFAASERMSDTIVSVAVYARGVNLYFMYGAALADPHHLLLGAGNQGRFVRLESPDTLDRRDIDGLLAAAIDEGETPPAPRPRIHRHQVGVTAAASAPSAVSAKL